MKPMIGLEPIFEMGLIRSDVEVKDPQRQREIGNRSLDV
jgi:hypothetical protein